MRINVYSQELTNEVKLLSKESDGLKVTGLPCFSNRELNGKPREELPSMEAALWREQGRHPMWDGTFPYREVREEPIVYHAAQLMLHSSTMLHHPPQDDDRSAVTFWLPKSKARREEMATAFEYIAMIFRKAPDSGLD